MALTKIGTDGVKDDAVTSGKIPANAVGSSELASSAVTNVKIAAGNVDNTAIGNNQVSLNKLVQGTSSNDGKFLRANNGADPSFETVSIPAGTTINNNANNRLITGSGTANTLEGESTATYNGTKLFLSGGSGSDGHIPMLEVKHLNTASSSNAGDGPAILLNGYYASNEWALAKIAASNAGGQYGSGYAGGLQFWVHPANGTQTASVIKGAEIIGNNGGADLYITDGNVKVASGHGIDFSATADGYSGSINETLDDYEEGYWTPTVGGWSASGTGVYGAQIGRYTKVGNLVTVFFHIYYTAINGASGVMAIENLPFSHSSNTYNMSTAIQVRYVDYSGDTVFAIGGNGYSSSFLLYSQSDNNNHNYVGVDSNGGRVEGTVTYVTNS